MRKIFLILFLLSGWYMGAEAQSAAGWRSLFNGKNLKGWETYVGPLEKGGKPLGIKKDPMKIYSVVKEDGQPAIRISGEINASLATRNSFENYHLHLEFKWGKLVFSQRNSGLLYHSYGPFGSALNVWMNSHELQMKHGNLGDLYCMGDTYSKIPCIKNGNQYIYQTGEHRWLSEMTKPQKFAPKVPTTKNHSANGTPSTCIALAVPPFTSSTAK